MLPVQLAAEAVLVLMAAPVVTVEQAGPAALVEVVVLEQTVQLVAQPMLEV
jgi:hypothetical protein